MISKYSLWTSVLVLNLLLFSSCLNSSDDRELVYSPDAQIYSFSIASKADTSNVLSAAEFTIDQVNGVIFNKEPLPFQFHVDSVTLNIKGASPISPFSDVTVQLITDSSFTWVQSDSIDVLRLNKIITTAPDGENKRTYQFRLNIYQQDPYILSWEKVSEGYLPQMTEQQKTVKFKNRFITYYIANEAVSAKSTPVDDGKNWTAATLTGLPPSIQLSTVTVADDTLFVIDEDNRVFTSSDGFSWLQISTNYTVVAIYGMLPAATKGKVLAMVSDNGTLKLAETDNFSSAQIIEIDGLLESSDLPVKYFSTTQIESATTYTVRYIAIAGGIKTDNSKNNDIWILQEKDNKISVLKTQKSNMVSIDGSSIFFYDQKPYLLTGSAGENNLLFLENYSLGWKSTENNQTLPTGFNYRKNTSIITDNNYIWIFGGVSEAQTQITDVWKGRLNKFELN